MNPVSSAKKGGFIGVDHNAIHTNKDQQAPLLNYHHDDHSLQIEETTIVNDTVTTHIRDEITATTLKEDSVTMEHVVHCQQTDTTHILIIICSTGDDYVAFGYNISTREIMRIQLPFHVTNRITSVSITESPSSMPKLPKESTTKRASEKSEKNVMSHVMVFLLSDGSICTGLLALHPDQVAFESYKYIDRSLVNNEKVTAAAIATGTIKYLPVPYSRPRIILGTDHGKVITFRVSRSKDGKIQLTYQDYTQFMKLEASPIVLLTSLRVGTWVVIAVGQNAVKSKGKSTGTTKQGVINFLATFANGRKSGFRVRPSLTKRLCDLDVMRLTLEHDDHFRLSAVFREQGYKNALEILCIYVGHYLKHSNVEFKVREPRRSGIMDLFQLGSGCIAMMAGQDDDRLRIVNSIPQSKQQNDTRHYQNDNTSTPEKHEHENMTSPSREETPEIKNDRSDLSFTESEALSPHSVISRDASSDIDGYGYSPENINLSRRLLTIRRHEDTTNTRDIVRDVLAEEDSFEEKLTAPRTRRQPLVVRHNDVDNENDHSEQGSPMSSPERVPDFQYASYSLFNNTTHVQQKVEFDQEQQNIRDEDKGESNHEQHSHHEDTIQGNKSESNHEQHTLHEDSIRDDKSEFDHEQQHIEHEDTIQDDKSECSHEQQHIEHEDTIQDDKSEFDHEQQHIEHEDTIQDDKSECSHEQQHIEHEDTIQNDKSECSHEQQRSQHEDTMRIDMDHEQQNEPAIPATKVDSLIPVPSQLNDPKQLQALVEEIGIVMNAQQQQSYNHSTTDRLVPSESRQWMNTKQDISSEEVNTVFEESQTTQSKYPDLNTLDEREDNNPLITPDNIPPSQAQKDLPATQSMDKSDIQDKIVSQDKEDSSISQEQQSLAHVESHGEDDANETHVTPSAFDSVDANVGIPEEAETHVYIQEETTQPTTTEEEHDTMDNSNIFDDMRYYDGADHDQALAGENSSFSGFLPLASDAAIESNIKFLSDVLEDHMTQQHNETTAPTTAMESSQTNCSLNVDQQLSTPTATTNGALSDNDIGRNHSMEQFVDKLNKWRPKAVNETLFIDLMLKQVDSQYIGNDTYLKENAPNLFHQLTQGNIQDSQYHRQTLYYLYLEHVDCGFTLASLDKVSDHERNKVEVYHMLDQGLYEEAIKYISAPSWLGDAWQYKTLKTLEKHCDIISFVRTTGIAERSLNDTMAYVELLRDMSIADTLEYMESMQNPDWQRHCLEWILDSVFKDDTKFDAQDVKVLGCFNYTKEQGQQFVEHTNESSSPIAKLALMYYYEHRKDWTHALRVMKELEAKSTHVKEHPAYDACLAVDRSVRQEMPDIMRHLPEEVMLYPRGQAVGAYKDFFKTHGDTSGVKLFGMALESRMKERERKRKLQEEEEMAFPNKR